MKPTNQIWETRESAALNLLRYDGHVNAPQEIVRMLAELVPIGSRVLDVGCGTGSVSRTIADARDVEIIGIEPNPYRAAAASGPRFESS